MKKKKYALNSRETIHHIIVLPGEAASRFYSSKFLWNNTTYILYKLCTIINVII